MDVSAAAVANRVIDALEREADSLAAGTMALARSAPFARIKGRRGAFVTALTPTPEQRAAARALERRLDECSETLEALIERKGAASGNISPLIRLLRRSILLQRTDEIGVRRDQWLDAFEQEVTTCATELKRIAEALRERAAPVPWTSEYDAFTVRMEALSANEWRVEVFSRLGVASAVVPPFTAPLLDPSIAAGQRLFNSIFAGPVLELFERSWAEAQLHGRGLRIQFDGLNSLPLETIHDGSRFIALASASPIVRRVSAGPTHFLQQPLRILVTACTAGDSEPLDSRRELKRIASAMKPLCFLGLARLDVAGDGSLDTTRRMLCAAQRAGRPYNAWHFIGHGSKNGGNLIMDAPGGESHEVSGTELDTVFQDYHELTLVVLNACEGGIGRARSAAADLTAGGMRSAIAMQYRVTDTAAVAFAAALYESIADGAMPAAAITEARRALFCQSQHRDWFMPVLFGTFPD